MDETKNGGALVVHPYEEFDAKRLALELTVQGETFAQKRQAFEFMKKMMPSYVIRLTMKYRQEHPETSKADARDIILASEEYETYVKRLTELEEETNLAKARRDGAKALFDGGRTEEVTRRTALYGGR